MKNTSSSLLLRQFVAELLGTLILAATVVTASLAGFSPFVALSVGIVVGVLVYLLGPTSGAHFNPAVTVAQAVYRQIKPIQAFLYIIAQVLGAFLGVLIVYAMVGATPLPLTSPTVGSYVAETFGAFIVVFAITKAVRGKIAVPLSGLVIGGAFVVAVGITASGNSGLLNPALALAFSSYSLSYLLMPLIGGIAGAGLAILLDPPTSKAS